MDEVDNEDRPTHYAQDGYVERSSDVFVDPFKDQKIRICLADKSKVEFRHGAFFLITEKVIRGEDIVQEKLLAQIDIEILRPICREREPDVFHNPDSALMVPIVESFRFRIVYDGEGMQTGSVDDIMRMIGGGGKMTGSTRMRITAFWVVLKSWCLAEKEYEVYHDEVEVDKTRIGVHRTVEYPETVLDIINELARVVTHPNAFSGLMSYMTIFPFSYELRQMGIITPIPLLEGKSQTGKTRMADLIVCQGMGQLDGLKTQQSVMTTYSQIQTMSNGRWPFIVDDVDMDFLDRFQGYMRSAVSGSGESQRGNLTVKGVTQWHVKRLPVLTTNRIDEVMEETANRFMQWRFGVLESQRVNRDSYFFLTERLQPGWMFVFLERWNGSSIDSLAARLKNGHDTKSLKQAYLDIGYDIICQTFKAHGRTCKLPPPILQESLTEEWGQIFAAWARNIQNAYNAFVINGNARSSPRVERIASEVEVTPEGQIRVSVRGFREFLAENRGCPYNARSFADRYLYSYTTVRIRGGPACKGISSTSLPASDD